MGISRRRYSIKRLESMPIEELLVAHKESGLCNADLTFIGEYLGKRCPPERAIPVLSELLEHESSNVREGAAIGLSIIVQQASLNLLKERLSRETSPGMLLVLDAEIKHLEEELEDQ